MSLASIMRQPALPHSGIRPVRHMLRAIALIAPCSLLLATPVAAVSLLGSAQPFAVLGASTVTNTGPTVISGDLGVSPGTAITGLGSITLSGALHQSDAVAIQAQADLSDAILALWAMPVSMDLTGQVLGTGGTISILTPGVYSFASSAQLNGGLTLDAQNNPDAAFIFLIGSTLTTASASSVTVLNGTAATQLYWNVGSSATLGTTTSFAGNILADQSITLNTGASILCGRALAANGAVTLDTNIITNDCGSGDFGSFGFSGGVVPEPASWALLIIGFGAVGAMSRHRRHQQMLPASA